MFCSGQRVECIDDAGQPSPLLRAGKTYTVLRMHDRQARNLDGTRGPGLLLHEVAPPFPYSAFDARRFRPVVEKKTDISVFTEILKRETVDDPLTVAKIVKQAERMFSRYSNR